MNKNIDISPEQAAKKRRLEHLKDLFLNSFIEHSKLISQDREALIALYIQLIGQHKLHLFVLITEIAQYKRRIAHCQAAFNRGETPDLEEIEIEVQKQFEQDLAEIQKQSELVEKTWEYLRQPSISEDELNEMRSIYYALAKRLHPDLNPDLSEEESLLFIQAKLAYERKDLERLKDIALAIDAKRPKDRQDLELDIDQEILILQERIAMINLRIVELKKSFPFNQRNLLFDERRLEEEQRNLAQAIEAAEKELEELKKKYHYIELCIKE